jgi:hypothetical protein
MNDPNIVKKNLVTQALSQSGYWMLNKTLVRKLGVYPSLILTNLIDQFLYFESKNEDKEWDHRFYLTHEKQKYQTSIGDKGIRASKKKLIEEGLIEVQKIGMPAKDNYLVDFDRIFKLLNEPVNNPNHAEIGTVTSPLQGSTSDTPQGSTYINDTYISNTKKESKDSIKRQRAPQSKRKRTTTPNPKEDPKPKKEWIKGGWQQEVLQAWNNLDGPTAHRDTTTKTIQQASYFLKALSNGTFWKMCKVSKEFAERNKIALDRLSKKKLSYPPAQIIKIVERYQTMWREGHWPQDKKYLPKSLSEFLYSPFTNKSFFLMLVYNPDILKSFSETEQAYHSPYESCFEWFLKPLDLRDVKQINSGIDRLGKWVYHNYNFRNNTVRKLFRSELKPALKPFFTLYSNWLEWDPGWNIEWLRENHREIFNPWGKVFNRFLDHIEAKHQISPMKRKAA